jgi:hypothetical protein
MTTNGEWYVSKEGEWLQFYNNKKKQWGQGTTSQSRKAKRALEFGQPNLEKGGQNLEKGGQNLEKGGQNLEKGGQGAGGKGQGTGSSSSSSWWQQGPEQPAGSSSSSWWQQDDWPKPQQAWKKSKDLGKGNQHFKLAAAPEQGSSQWETDWPFHAPAGKSKPMMSAIWL